MQPCYRDWSGTSPGALEPSRSSGQHQCRPTDWSSPQDLTGRTILNHASKVALDELAGTAGVIVMRVGYEKNAREL